MTLNSFLLHSFVCMESKTPSTMSILEKKLQNIQTTISKPDISQKDKNVAMQNMEEVLRLMRQEVEKTESQNKKEDKKSTNSKDKNNKEKTSIKNTGQNERISAKNTEQNAKTSILSKVNSESEEEENNIEQLQSLNIQDGEQIVERISQIIESINKKIEFDVIFESPKNKNISILSQKIAIETVLGNIKKNDKAVDFCKNFLRILALVSNNAKEVGEWLNTNSLELFTNLMLASTHAQVNKFINIINQSNDPVVKHISKFFFSWFTYKLEESSNETQAKNKYIFSLHKPGEEISTNLMLRIFVGFLFYTAEMTGKLDTKAETAVKLLKTKTKSIFYFCLGVNTHNYFRQLVLFVASSLAKQGLSLFSDLQQSLFMKTLVRTACTMVQPDTETEITGDNFKISYLKKIDMHSFAYENDQILDIFNRKDTKYLDLIKSLETNIQKILYKYFNDLQQRTLFDSMYENCKKEISELHIKGQNSYKNENKPELFFGEWLAGCEFADKIIKSKTYAITFLIALYKAYTKFLLYFSPGITLMLISKTMAIPLDDIDFWGEVTIEKSKKNTTLQKVFTICRIYLENIERNDVRQAIIGETRTNILSIEDLVFFVYTELSSVIRSLLCSDFIMKDFYSLFQICGKVPCSRFNMFNDAEYCLIYRGENDRCTYLNDCNFNKQTLLTEDKILNMRNLKLFFNNVYTVNILPTNPDLVFQRCNKKEVLTYGVKLKDSNSLLFQNVLDAAFYNIPNNQIIPLSQICLNGYIPFFLNHLIGVTSNPICKIIEMIPKDFNVQNIEEQEEQSTLQYEEEQKMNEK